MDAQYILIFTPLSPYLSFSPLSPLTFWMNICFWNKHLSQCCALVNRLNWHSSLSPLLMVKLTLMYSSVTLVKVRNIQILQFLFVSIRIPWATLYHHALFLGFYNTFFWGQTRGSNSWPRPQKMQLTMGPYHCIGLSYQTSVVSARSGWWSNRQLRIPILHVQSNYCEH